MAFRGFVAVPVAAQPPLPALLEEIGALRADVKPVEPANLHFTLSFLGQVEDGMRPALEGALAEAAHGMQPFDVELHGVGAFPSARRPRVVWAGVVDPRPIVALALRVREELAKVGAPADDKDFRAHLTLARVKSEAGVHEVVSFLKRHGGDELPTTRVKDVRLYRSVLGPTALDVPPGTSAPRRGAGPTYETLFAAPLEAA